jgi:hypothetical protein
MSYAPTETDFEMLSLAAVTRNVIEFLMAESEARGARNDGMSIAPKFEASRADTSASTSIKEEDDAGTSPVCDAREESIGPELDVTASAGAHGGWGSPAVTFTPGEDEPPGVTGFEVLMRSATRSQHVEQSRTCSSMRSIAGDGQLKQSGCVIALPSPAGSIDPTDDHASGRAA